ncbi:MAG TPA: roadblock/LC7 domain-containing protein [Candidatus Polarisedimenticolaceae bacterium]|nr:roadblock/LC7 domain-containing protein [Candidatus Polarisedimenticolaceae bacterium]
MSRACLVVHEQDHASFMAVLERLRTESNSRFIFLLDKNGQQIAKTGDLGGSDPTALASLAAGNVAATEGLAQLIGESEFSTLFHEGEKDSLHISVIANKVILLVIFDEHSSLGLVRLRVKQRSDELAGILEAMLRRGDGEAAGIPASTLGEITDEDIDALFG